mmetsp:Transcript_45620/g.89866  ORF Transcript_45620/g.89866 Transcript_45620/m.89866 type:complete len:212 (+) Transcript_45620:600-1235(+)
MTRSSKDFLFQSKFFKPHAVQNESETAITASHSARKCGPRAFIFVRALPPFLLKNSTILAFCFPFQRGEWSVVVVSFITRTADQKGIPVFVVCSRDLLNWGEQSREQSTQSTPSASSFFFLLPPCQSRPLVHEERPTDEQKTAPEKCRGEASKKNAAPFLSVPFSMQNVSLSSTNLFMHSVNFRSFPSECSIDRSHSGMQVGPPPPKASLH